MTFVFNKVRCHLRTARAERALALSLMVSAASACADDACRNTREAGEPEVSSPSEVVEEAVAPEPDVAAQEPDTQTGGHDEEGGDAAADGTPAFDAGAFDAAPEASDATQRVDAQTSALEDAGSTRQITIRFKAEVSGQEFACGRDYDGQGKSAVKATPSDLRFFVHDVRLIDERGEEVPLRLATREPWQVPELALIDFEDAQGRCAAGNAGMNHELTGSVPAGNYHGVAFVLGVPVALNHADPALAPAPLRNAPGMLWSWALGYKFMVAGLDQVVPVGQSGGLAALHIGSAGCSGDVCMRPNRGAVRFARFDPELDVVAVDLGTVYAQTDLSTQAECHSFGPQCVAPFAALGVDYETGTQLTGHPAFRALRR